MKHVSSLILLTCLMLPAVVAADQGPFNIDVIVSATGSGGFLGQEEQDSLVIAEKTFNKSGGVHGRPIHFVFYDDQSSPQLAVQLANQIVANNPAVVIGSTLVANCNAMAPLMKTGPVNFCFSPGIHPPSGSRQFTAGVSTFDQADALVRYFRMRGLTTIGLMTSSDATGQDANRGFTQLLQKPEANGVKIVADVHFNPTDVNVSAQLERVKEAHPAAFIGWATGSPSATIFRDAQQVGLDMPMGTTGGNMTYAQMNNFADLVPKELYLPASEWPSTRTPGVEVDPRVSAKQKKFYEAFSDAGKQPDEGSVLAWDPASIVVDALRALPEGATSGQLHDYLETMTGVAGVSGIYDFVNSPQRGLSIDDVIVTRWDKAAQRWLVVSKPTGVPL